MYIREAITKRKLGIHPNRREGGLLGSEPLNRFKFFSFTNIGLIKDTRSNKSALDV